MKKLNFLSDRESSNPRKRTPMPYFIPATTTTSTASSLPSLHMMNDNSVYSFHEKKINDERIIPLFNPYFYIAANTCEIAPHECVRIYFDSISNYHCFDSDHGYDGCAKKYKNIFFLLQNNSDSGILKIPIGTRLLSVLITPKIQSDIIPAHRCFSISE